jgi:hypothetical protein
VGGPRRRIGRAGGADRAYPDQLIALISGASLYPLQIVEPARFLDDHAK